MKEATAEQIENWKKEYFAVYQISGENNEVGYLSFPTFPQWKQAVTAVQKSDVKFVESILNNCWLYGDESIKTNYAYFDKLKNQIDEIIEFGDVVKKRVGNHYEVIVTGSARYDGGKKLVFDLRPVTLEIVNSAERNSDKSAFSRGQNILKMVILKEGKKVLKEHLKDKNPYYYVPLLSVVEKLYEDKVLTVKKL